MRCSSVEQSGQNDARRLHRWLEHGSTARLQRILSSSRTRAARQAHAKAANASSVVGCADLCRGALASRCSSVEQSGQNDARRLRRWLEHGSEAHLQRILSSSRARAARQAYTKAASASSLMHGGQLCRGALASCCSSIEQTGQNDARRLRRWLEHGSEARLQRIVPSSRAGAARPAHAKAASTSSLMGGKELFCGALASCCSSIEQSGQNDARRLHRWLEHGSKAHLQRILSGRFAGASRQAHAKAASTSSLVGGEELCRGALALPCSSVEQSQARTMPAASTAGKTLSIVAAEGDLREFTLISGVTVFHGRFMVARLSSYPHDFSMTSHTETCIAPISRTSPAGATHDASPARHAGRAAL